MVSLEVHLRKLGLEFKGFPALLHTSGKGTALSDDLTSFEGEKYLEEVVRFSCTIGWGLDIIHTDLHRAGTLQISRITQVMSL